eukprot:TRINITY_DN9928_c0_g1_i4.p1 TRINITY_DN9928_c0_g1~~TRINITY_DN9928_c0_g1_i4.p1  ORF type:complete len:530 (-),score=69.98 TRINITY_DN9928_c0_g1_i4:140-1729(-)
MGYWMVSVSLLTMRSDCSCICRFFHCGRFGDGHYLAMELLGQNLNELRNKQAGRRFSVATTMRLAIQMIRAIEYIHSIGFVHRDIKPSNFAMGIGPNKDRCYILDFGLSRRFLNEDGKVRPERSSVGFRGTGRYASLNAHEGKDLSRRDDLWSLFYCLVEFLRGHLPWRQARDRAEIKEVKKMTHNLDIVRGLPLEFGQLFTHLTALQFDESPDYVWIENLFYMICSRDGLDSEAPYDWDAPLATQQPSRTDPSLQEQKLMETGSENGSTATKDRDTSRDFDGEHLSKSQYNVTEAQTTMARDHSCSTLLDANERNGSFQLGNDQRNPSGNAKSPQPGRKGSSKIGNDGYWSDATTRIMMVGDEDDDDDDEDWDERVPGSEQTPNGEKAFLPKLPATFSDRGSLVLTPAPVSRRSSARSQGADAIPTPQARTNRSSIGSERDALRDPDRKTLPGSAIGSASSIVAPPVASPSASSTTQPKNRKITSPTSPRVSVSNETITKPSHAVITSPDPSVATLPKLPSSSTCLLL